MPRNPWDEASWFFFFGQNNIINALRPKQTLKQPGDTFRFQHFLGVHELYFANFSKQTWVRPRKWGEIWWLRPSAKTLNSSARQNVGSYMDVPRDLGPTPLVANTRADHDLCTTPLWTKKKLCQKMGAIQQWHRGYGMVVVEHFR